MILKKYLINFEISLEFLQSYQQLTLQNKEADSSISSKFFCLQFKDIQYHCAEYKRESFSRCSYWVQYVSPISNGNTDSLCTIFDCILEMKWGKIQFFFTKKQHSIMKTYVAITFYQIETQTFHKLLLFFP